MANALDNLRRTERCSAAMPANWAGLKGPGGKTYQRAKPREDGPLATIFGDPPKAVFEGVT